MASWWSTVAKKNDKSEKATPQKRREARREGQVAKSAEVAVLAGLLVSALTVRVFGPTAVDAFAEETSRQFATLDPTTLPGTADALQLMALGGTVLGPFMIAAVVAGLGAGLAQTKGNVSLKAARPKLKNLDPRKGLEKLKPGKAGWELLRTLVKLGLLVLVVWNPMLDVRDELGGGLGADAGIAALSDQVWNVLLRGVAVAFVIAVADYAWNRWQHEKQLRMSKQDIKDEHKRSEGDPLMKGERRRRAAQLSRNRMLADVAGADVVLVNPTEYAIALRYVRGEAAPKVVAKGMDHLARRIREEATRAGVPIHVDVALTRAMYPQVKVGGWVPQDLYEAVAVVLVWAYRRTGARPASRSLAATAGGVR